MVFVIRANKAVGSISCFDFMNGSDCISHGSSKQSVSDTACSLVEEKYSQEALLAFLVILLPAVLKCFCIQGERFDVVSLQLMRSFPK